MDRAVSVLAAFLPNRAGLGLAEIASLCGLSTSTAHRYCSALRRHGLLRYDADTAQFSLGGRCIELGLAATESLPVVEFARPALSELVRNVDRTAVLGVWDEYAVRVVEVNDHTSSIVRVTVRLGSQLDVFDSAQGLLFLAHSSRVSQRFARDPEMDRVKDTVDRIKVDGYATSTTLAGNSSTGSRIIASPVFLDDQIVATLAVVGSVETMVDHAGSRMVSHLREAAEQLSRRLSTEA